MTYRSATVRRAVAAARPRRYLLAVVDTLAWLCAVQLATALRFDLSPDTRWMWGAAKTAALAAGIHVLLATGLRMYSGRHRLGTHDEAVTLALVAGFVGAMFTAVLQFPFVPRVVPLSVPIGATPIAILICFAARLAMRRVGNRSFMPTTGLRTLVVGAGDGGTWLVRDLLTNPDAPYRPIGFVDDNPKLAHYRVGHVRVLGTVNDLARLILEVGAERVLVAAPSAPAELFRRVNDQVAATRAKVKVLPPLAELVGESPGLRDLRDLDMEDLLGRRQVQTDLTEVAAYLAGRRVLVTGAGGSIGSELCRQIHRLHPDRLGMLDRDESALHALQLSIDGHGLMSTRDLILADIRDQQALAEAFAEFRPEVVFHAAALKHLPMLQMYPAEGVKTNVIGTANVLAAAGAVDVGIFVNISTDKAADPSSVLGSTKRSAEHLTAQAARDYLGRYVSVRFGNVLGSRGSVLSAFAEQIRLGGPVTVTDPEVTRYFMTVPEAVQLVLQAGALGGDGEVMVLDMGTPVSIKAVAEQLIGLSGRRVSIEYTGLRPGEKLHEVLSSATEELTPTPHPLIRRVGVEPRALAELVIISSDVDEPAIRLP